MSTNYETLRDAIYTVLSGISNIGQVHKQKRWSADKEVFKAAYMATISGTNQIRAWWISRVATSSATMTRKFYQRDYVFQLEGYMGLDDSANTEQTFQTLIDTVMDTLDIQRPNLGGANHQEPVILEAYSEVVIGGYLCHHAVLRLTLVKFSN